MKTAGFIFVILWWNNLQGCASFQPLLPQGRPLVLERCFVRSAHITQHPATSNGRFEPTGVLEESRSESTTDARQQSAAAIVAVALLVTPTPALATAGPVPSAILAWLHFVGILGVAGGLMTERFLLKKNMNQEEEMKINQADGIYGFSAFSLLITGYFRVTDFAKGWDFYRNEPIFWLKMSSVAVLGGLSFFPAIVFFRRDQARQRGQILAPLSDKLVDRLSTLINAEILAVLTIPFFASLMARGVLYVDNFPWAVGVVLYAVSLGGAGYKYGKEAFDMMESEQALAPLSTKDSAAS
jgi:putative membrane protein